MSWRAWIAISVFVSICVAYLAYLIGTTIHIFASNNYFYLLALCTSIVIFLILTSLPLVHHRPATVYYGGSRVVTLNMDVAVPGKTVLNEAFDLAVMVRHPNLPAIKEKDLRKVKSGRAKVLWPTDRPYISLRVKVRAPDCTIHDSDSRFFRLYKGRSSSRLYFNLIPRRVGIISITVELYQEDDEIDNVRVRTTVYERPVGVVEIGILTRSIVLPEKPSRPMFTGSASRIHNEEVAERLEVLVAKRRRLHILEVRAATEGRNAKPEVLTEIEDIKREIEQLEQELG